MTQEVNFSDRDFEGLLIGLGDYAFTSDVNEDSAWTQIQVGGENNSFPVIALEVTGEATSPSSFSSNPKDRQLYLEVKQVARGAGSANLSGVSAKYAIIKWKDGEVSTEKEAATPVKIFLNTYNRVDGNIFVRVVSENSGTTFTNLDINVATFGIYSNKFAVEAVTSLTNNFHSTGANASANTVEAIPASSTGYVEFGFTQFGYKGDIKLSNRVGVSPSAEVGSDPKYYWKYSDGDGTGNTPLVEAWHDGTRVVNDLSCDEEDTLRIERNGSNQLLYKKNGVTQATGATTETAELKGDIKLININARLIGLKMDIGAGEISPTLENLSNMQIT